MICGIQQIISNIQIFSVHIFLLFVVSYETRYNRRNYFWYYRPSIIYPFTYCILAKLFQLQQLVVRIPAKSLITYSKATDIGIVHINLNQNVLKTKFIPHRIFHTS